jgi:putative hydrolase of the HAD superfamily
MSDAQQKYLIWDFDGTLAWRPGGWTGALLTVLRQSYPTLKVTSSRIRPYLQSGFPWHAPENPHPGLSSNDWWDDMQPVFARAFRSVGVQNGEALDLARGVRQAYLDPMCWQRYKDSLPALEALSARGWTHILLSNHTPELTLLVDRLGLAQYFAAQFNSGETGYEKPNPKAFRQALEWIQPGATAWMIGDSFGSDILGALENGLPGILVRKPHPEAPVFCASLLQLAEKL